jgi:hypothetical protein
MSHITSIPSEIIQEILEYMNIRDVISFTATCHGYRHGEYLGNRLYIRPYKLSKAFVSSSMMKEVISVDMTLMVGRATIDRGYKCESIILNGDGRCRIGWRNRFIQTIVVSDGDAIADVYGDTLCMPSLTSIRLPYYIDRESYDESTVLLLMFAIIATLAFGAIAIVLLALDSGYFWIPLGMMMAFVIIDMLLVAIIVWGCIDAKKYRRVVSVADQP